MSDRIDASPLQDYAARLMRAHGMDEAQVRTQAVLWTNAAAARRLRTPAAGSEVAEAAARGAIR